MRVNAGGVYVLLGISRYGNLRERHCHVGRHIPAVMSTIRTQNAIASHLRSLFDLSCPCCGEKNYHGYQTVHDTRVVTVKYFCRSCYGDNCIKFDCPDADITQCPFCRGPLLLGGNSVIGPNSFSIGRVCYTCGASVVSNSPDIDDSDPVKVQSCYLRRRLKRSEDLCLLTASPHRTSVSRIRVWRTGPAGKSYEAIFCNIPDDWYKTLSGTDAAALSVIVTELCSLASYVGIEQLLPLLDRALVLRESPTDSGSALGVLSGMWHELSAQP